MGKMETSESVPRERREHGARAGRALRCVLGGSLLAGTLAVGGVALVGTAPAGAESTASGTCTPALAPTPAQEASTTGITSKSVTVGNVSIISGPVPGLFEGAPTGVKAYFDMINAAGRRRRPQAAGRLEGRRLQRPAEPDGDAGGDQQRLRPGRQLLALRRVRVRRLGQRHRRARRLGDARRRDQCAAQRLQRAAAVRAGDPRACAVLQEALPQGHDRRRHRLGRRLGQDPDGPAVRRHEERGLQDRLRGRRQPACSPTSPPTSST